MKRCGRLAARPPKRGATADRPERRKTSSSASTLSTGSRTVRSLFLSSSLSRVHSFSYLPSSIMPGPILVIGATGQQGSAVLRSLQSVSNCPPLRALTRSVDSPKAQALQKQGVEVVKGTLEDVESLKRALEGASAAFLVTVMPGKGGLEEDQQGFNFIKAAKAVNLPYVVFTSVSDATPTCGVPHFETKARVEAALKESGLKHAVVAPVAFYDNLPRQASLGSFFGMGLFDAGLAGKKLQMVACDDIGDVAAKMLLDPVKYAGRHVKLAGDELTMTEAQNAYARVEGHGVWKAWLPSIVLYALPYDLRAMFQWFYNKGYSSDLSEVRNEFPTVRSFEQWLREGRKQE
ncbi:hypothetical protein BMF94_3721 [Rhodotorula taiwanensis]|uniref:NmrA-like domain-containing protein n=1 Tax=Rhodotorula taiwanensis TaxID=741276 RepID=A0A2S5B9D6_9BASI|nr:hypothetical protein BMF94_3721 [Rhodotorula taiwanensis]